MDTLSLDRSAPPGAPLKLATFEIVRPLGNGASGLVFEAVDRTRGVAVALKTLRNVGGEALLQLKEEFHALQDLDHPNLVRLGELMRDGDTWFFTMELIDGVGFLEYVSGLDGRFVDAHSTLRARGIAPRLRRPADDDSQPRHFDEARLRSALSQLAEGVAALHAARKVHRDLKPPNVLVDRSGRVVILDFGLVRDSDAGADEGIVGTARYMAPEQAEGGAATGAADWYAVGAMLYECLTGRAPFEGPVHEVLVAKLQGEPPPPRHFVPGVPSDLDALCTALLRLDPEARPSDGDVLARLAPAGSRRTLALGERGSGRVPFIGREAELEALRGAFEDARRGRTVVVEVQGESGVGKSALTRRFVAELPSMAPDVVVLTGRCYERDAVPYRAVDGLVDSLSQYLGELDGPDVLELLPDGMGLVTEVFPVLRRVAAVERHGSMAPRVDVDVVGLQQGRARLFSSVRELFARVARRRPLVLVIDDMQWADGDSLALLTEMLRPPLAPPLLLLTTARTRSDDDRLSLPGDVRAIPIARLSEGEGLALATALLRRSASDLDPAVATTIAAEARGHPLFVDELVRHARLHGGATPQRLALDEAMAARVAELDPGARTVLELLAVSGVALSQDTIMHASALPFVPFSAHVRALRAGHLARTSGFRGHDLIECYHDRVRESVAARLEAGRRAERHRALALAIEVSTRPDADAIAVHWLGAGDTSRARVYTVRAAELAQRALAFDRAALLYERALGLMPAGDPERGPVTARLGDAFANNGRGAEAARAYSAAAALARGDAVIELKRRAAEHLLNAGRFDEGDAALREVLAAVSLRLPRSPLAALVGLLLLRARLWLRGLAFRERTEAEIPSQELTRLEACGGVALLLSVVDTIRGAYFQTHTLLLALEAGEPARLSHALSLEAGFLTGRGPSGGPGAARVFGTAEAIGTRLDTPQVRGAVTGARAFSQFCQGRFGEAFRLSEAAIAILSERPAGAFWDLRMSKLISVWALTWRGELGELARRADALVREADERGDLYAATCVRAGPPTIAWLCGDDAVGARELVRSAMAGWTQRGYHNQHYWGLLAESQIDLYLGSGKEVYARVVRHWPRMKRSLMLEVQIIRIEATNLRARAALAAAVEDPSARRRMLRAAARDGRALSRLDASYAHALAALIDASVLTMTRRKEDAAARLHEAIAGFEQASMTLHAMAARWRLGSILGGDAGQKLLDRAEGWLREQGVASPARMVRMVAPGFDIERFETPGR